MSVDTELKLKSLVKKSVFLKKVSTTYADAPCGTL